MKKFLLAATAALMMLNAAPAHAERFSNERMAYAPGVLIVVDTHHGRYITPPPPRYVPVRYIDYRDHDCRHDHGRSYNRWDNSDRGRDHDRRRDWR